MSYANGTQFYNLPQTVGTDKRDWFDTNAAFAAIDAALHTAVTGQAADAEAISTINSKLAADESAIAALQTASSTQEASISALQTAVNGQATQIADVRQDAEDMISAYNEGAAETSTHSYAIGDYFIYNDVLYKATAAIAIGDTIVPNTNCQATNVTTEINEVKSDLAGKLSTSKLVYGDFTDTTDEQGRIELPFKLGLVSLYSVWCVSGAYAPIVRSAATQNTQNNCLAYIKNVNDMSACPANTELHVYYAYILL